MITKNTVVKTDKEINFDMSIISDIHADKDTDLGILDRYLEEFKKYNLQYIAILGDILNDGTDVESAKRISDYFYKMGKIAPVMMILGNHDKVTLKDDRWYVISNDEDLAKFNEMVSIFKDIPGVNFLSNSGVLFGDLYFYGMDPQTEYYFDATPLPEKIDMLYSHVINMSKYNYNVLLSHSPQLVIDKRMIDAFKFYKDVDLILTGHMHNGFLPVYMEWMFPGNRGLLGSKFNKPYLFPDIAKGSVQLRNNLTGIIANPVCTIPSFKGSVSKYNSLYPPVVNNVKVRKLI